MTLHVTHLFVSPKGDGPDSTLVRPSAVSGGWNADHKLVTDSTVPMVLGRQSVGAGAIEELPISVIFPVGVVVPYAGATAPAGWLLCFGQSLVQTDYPALYSVIQQTYGGDATHFALPDLRGTVVAGKSNMGGADRGTLPGGAVLGQFLGWHQSSTGSITSSGSNFINFGDGLGRVYFNQTSGGANTGNLDNITTSGGSTAIASINSVNVAGYMNVFNNFAISVSGASGYFPVIQSTVVLNYIIKT